MLNNDSVAQLSFVFSANRAKNIRHCFRKQTSRSCRTIRPAGILSTLCGGCRRLFFILKVCETCFYCSKSIFRPKGIGKFFSLFSYGQCQIGGTARNWPATHAYKSLVTTEKNFVLTKFTSEFNLRYRPYN